MIFAIVTCLPSIVKAAAYPLHDSRIPHAPIVYTSAPASPPVACFMYLCVSVGRTSISYP